MMHLKEMFEIARKTPRCRVALCIHSYGSKFRVGQFVIATEHQKDGNWSIGETILNNQRFNDYFHIIYDEDDISDNMLLEAINNSTIFAGFSDVEKFEISFKINDLECSINFNNTLYDLKYNDEYGEQHEATFGSPFEVIDFLQSTYNEGVDGKVVTGYGVNYDEQLERFRIIASEGVHKYDSSTFPDGNVSGSFKKIYFDFDALESDVDYVNDRLVKCWSDAVEKFYSDEYYASNNMVIFGQACKCEDCGKYFLDWRHINSLKKGMANRTKTHCLNCSNKIIQNHKTMWRESYNGKDED